MSSKKCKLIYKPLFLALYFEIEIKGIAYLSLLLRSFSTEQPLKSNENHLTSSGLNAILKHKIHSVKLTVLGNKSG